MFRKSEESQGNTVTVSHKEAQKLKLIEIKTSYKLGSSLTSPDGREIKPKEFFRKKQRYHYWC